MSTAEKFRAPISNPPGNEPEPPPNSGRLSRRKNRGLIVRSFRTTEEREEQLVALAQRIGISTSLLIENIVAQALRPRAGDKQLENRDEQTRRLVNQLSRLWSAA